MIFTVTVPTTHRGLLFSLLPIYMFDVMLTKANGKLSVGFSGVWLSQCLCISELFNLHSANHPQAARIIYLGHGLPKPPSSLGKMFPPLHVIPMIWEESSQEQAGWVATEEDVPVWLPTFSGCLVPTCVVLLCNAFKVRHVSRSILKPCM